jgi:hypothetical protein
MNLSRQAWKEEGSSFVCIPWSGLRPWSGFKGWGAMGVTVSPSEGMATGRDGSRPGYMGREEPPESESNLEVDVLRNIGIDIRPGFRVESRERSDHEASSSRFVPESGSNQESDQAAPIRYEIGLARRDGGWGRWARRRP